jgi:hypothetical protein
MLLGPSKLYLAFLVTVLVIATQACAVSQQSTADATVTATYTQPSSVKSPTSLASITMIDSATPAATSAENASPSPTTALITVTAVTGRLSIRSGPDISFDAIAVLENGQTATAVARSVIDGWLQIPIPSQPSKMGWVSTMTDHSIVTGNVLDLPRIDEVDWPAGSYILNCTQHRLIVRPGEQIVQSVSASPQNRVWFAPGLYTVYDLDMSGQPVVLNLNIRAHGQVTVHKDGSHQWSDCP